MSVRQRFSWTISCKGYWWIPSIRCWVPNNELFSGEKKRAFSSHADAPNKKAAFRIALKCPEISTVTCIDYSNPSKYPRGFMRIYEV